jgi:ABC-2 type transport system permease protein
VRTEAELNELFRQNKIELAVAFSEDLNRRRPGSRQIQVIADATDPNQAITCNAYLQGILSPALAELQAASPSGTALNLHTRLLYNPQMRSAYNFVPGVMGLILMLICAMMTSISIVREKETGTMEVLLVSPVPPLFVILSKAVPYFLLSILNLTTILLLSVFVLHVPIAGSLTALSGVSLLFIFVSLSLGLLISCVTRTQVAALLISAMLLMMPTILLSGMIFPVESMPLILQGFSCLIPARWYISVVRKLMIEGVPFACVWQETCILFLMGTILIGITTRKFKNRLE